MTTRHPAYVGLGSNLDEPREQVSAAFTRLEALRDTRLVRRSALYGSTPFGPIAQPDYVNAVAGLLTSLDVEVFFAELRALERALGREPPRERWGPRRIDLDLLVFGSLIRESHDLTVPHPGLGARNFVLQPLAEVAPELEVPGLGRVAALAAAASPEGLWRLSA
jgi:2-amino-4-hydroxy-6-hydroxymethyldihydropteridine diphosphokinase